MGPQTRVGDYFHAMKYRGDGEDFREAVNRFSSAMKDSDEHFHQFRDISLDMRFMPAGRVQSAMGSIRATTPYNCYVSGTIEDSFVHGEGNIMQRATEAAATMRMGGGIGYDFSTLRPKGTLIRKLQSHSSGPISFMEIYDAICRCVASSGHRRGAQMGVLRVDHPDIEEFLHAKQNTDKLTGFNISIAVTDEFMEAAMTGRTFYLRWGGEVYKEVDAAALWESIMRSTWDWAEPGVLFIDTINNMNNLWYCETLAATNPCFTGETKVWTEHGHVAFKDLVGKTVSVLTQNWEGQPVYRPMSNIRITQRQAKLVQVSFDNGTSVECTPNHMFFLRGGGQIEAERLQPGMSIASAYRYKANSKGYLRVATEGGAPLEHHIPFEGGIPDGYDVHHVDEVKSHNWSSNLELKTKSEHSQHHISGDRNPMRRFPEKNHFNGRDNTGAANGRWRSELSTEMMLEDREAGMSFEAIAAKHGCSKYTAQKRVKESNHRVVAVKVLDRVEDVYCGSVDEFNRFFVALGDNDGVLVHNCGEQPLPPFGACLLGSFNLVKYVRPKTVRSLHEPAWSFDWDQLKADIPHVVRAMDNVVDRARYPLPQQEREAKDKRRMGLGMTGVANALEALDFPYGSPGYLEFQSKVEELIAVETYRASAELAGEKGAFPLYDERYLDGRFIKQLPDDVQALIRKNGIRNSHLTSIAPTGTISLCADNVSSGIEPVFDYVTARPVNTPGGQELVEVEDYGVANFGVKGRRASEVTAQEHVGVLCVSQKWVDSSVSKTCNMDGSMPWADFKGLYQSAWEGGAKGCTTFNQDGKRMALLTGKSDKPKEEDGGTNSYAEPVATSCTIDPDTGRRECA